MRKLLMLLLTLFMLFVCCGCFWEVDRGEHGDRDRGDHERGRFEEHEGRH